jgi:hypothetical protein
MPRTVSGNDVSCKNSWLRCPNRLEAILAISMRI